MTVHTTVSEGNVTVMVLAWSLIRIPMAARVNCAIPLCRNIDRVLIFLPLAMEPIGGYITKSVTHGQQTWFNYIYVNYN